MKEPSNSDHESDRRRNLLICTNCLRKSFVFQLPQHQWNTLQHKWIIHAATQCTRGQQVQSRFAETRFAETRFAETRFAETPTLTLTLNPNFGETGFGESGFGESGRHQPRLIPAKWQKMVNCGLMPQHVCTSSIVPNAQWDTLFRNTMKDPVTLSK